MTAFTNRKHRDAMAAVSLAIFAMLAAPLHANEPAAIENPAAPRGLGFERAGGEWNDAQTSFYHTCGLCHVTGVGPELRGRHLPPQYVVQTARSGWRAMPAIRPTEINDRELMELAKWLENSSVPAATKGNAPQGALQ